MHVPGREGSRGVNLPSAEFDGNRHGIMQHLSPYCQLQYDNLHMRAQVRETVCCLFHLRYGSKVQKGGGCLECGLKILLKNGFNQVNQSMDTFDLRPLFITRKADTNRNVNFAAPLVSCPSFLVL
jgi:hypothetical protein